MSTQETTQDLIDVKLDQARGVADTLCQAGDSLQEITRQQLAHLLSDLLRQLDDLMSQQNKVKP